MKYFYSHVSYINSIKHQSKKKKPRKEISKKTTAAEKARHDAMAARSLHKLRHLRNAIITSIGNAIKMLHRTKDNENPSFHQMPVCVCCDNFIIGTERVHRMKKKTLKNTSLLLV